MEPSTSAGPSPRRPELGRTDSFKLQDGNHKSRTPQTSLSQRGTRYKEKFQALRDKYEQVNATHEDLEKELASATTKMRKLRDECNLLLDAVDIASSGSSSIMHYLSNDPIPPQYQSAAVVGPSVPPPSSPLPPEPVEPSYDLVTTTNGNGRGEHYPDRYAGPHEPV